ncbi:uncharacterized protein (DUF1499 family) [Pseudomonas cedrina]|nr:uncharacterized protein (DUF1499 family) [Pseudomonas cedrina]
MGQSKKMPAIPPPSQPRQGSTAPTFDPQRCSNCASRHTADPTHAADPLWELSSFSEAAKAECQALNESAVPPPSQPRRGSTAPTFDPQRCSNCASRQTADPTHAADPLWELSSSSEAAKAECQALNKLAVPPLSQPRRGSTAPTFDPQRCSNCASRHTADPTHAADPLWELSSFSEAAKAVGQAKKKYQPCRRLRSPALLTAPCCNHAVRCLSLSHTAPQRPQ